MTRKNTDRKLMIEQQIRDSMTIADRRHSLRRMVRDMLRVLPVYCGPGSDCEAALVHLEAMWRSAEASITADAAGRRRRGRPPDLTAA